MAVQSYGRGEKRIIFDTDVVGLTLDAVGDELWFVPYVLHGQLPNEPTWEITLSGAFTAGALALEGTLGQEHSIEGPAPLSDRLASAGPTWFSLDTYVLTSGATVRFVANAKVRAIRVRISTTITGTTPRAIVALAT